MKTKKFLLKYFTEIFIVLFGFIFASFLMFSSFSSTSRSISISSKAWSDFASHIPLIRSFSFGSNFPTEYPLFPGEPINYHFLFYAFVGFLEKIGIPIGLALNIPSVMGFVFLILMIYLLALLIFKSKAVGVVSVIFFLFNSSLSFIYFFRNYPLSLNSLNQIITNPDFVSFAPYGDGIISAFWNLNIYTNQRHLALSFALSLFILFLILRTIFSKYKLNLKLATFLGIIFGLSFFLHFAVFLMTWAVIFSSAIFFPKIRKESLLLLIIAALVAFPQYLYVSQDQGFNALLSFGFLVSDKLSIYNFFEFWVYNLGLSLILIPLGFIFAGRNQKKILLSFFSLFLIGNLIQFSPEISANHKFFNYFLLIGNMFSAFALYKLWNKKLFFKPIIAGAFFLMIFGGIIDFFPIYNDHRLTLNDYGADKDIAWILENTSADSVFLNSTFLYNPASLAGRKIFLGWPYFAWSQGYDTDKRMEVMSNMLGASDKQTACALLKENEIDYIEIKKQDPPDPNIPPISTLFEEEFKKIYNNNSEDYFIYSVDSSCNNL